MEADILVPPIPRPDTQPASGSRPQSHRYLKSTVMKLGEDAYRAERHGLYGDTPSTTAFSSRPATSPMMTESSMVLKRAGTEISPFSLVSSPTPKQRTPLPDPMNPAMAADAWRTAFHSEAMDCVQSMQSVVDSANLKSFASRFDDWRKTDMKATAEMQQHVKELKKVNALTEEFLLKCTNVASLTDFYERLTTLTTRADELAVTRDEMSANADAIAARAAAKVVANLKSEMRNTTTLLRSHVDETVQWRSSNSEECSRMDAGLVRLSDRVEELVEGCKRQCQQVNNLEFAQKEAKEHVVSMMEESITRMHNSLWDKLDARFSQLQDQVGNFSNEIRSQQEHVGRLDATQQQTSETVMAAFEGAVKDMHDSATRSAVQLTSSLRHNAEKDLAAFEKHVTNALNDSKSSLKSLDMKVAEWERTAKAESVHWRGMSDRLREQVGELEEALAKAKKSQAHSERQHDEAVKHVHNLQTDLHHTQSELEGARADSFTNAMRRLLEFEQRGNLQVNRQTGDVRVQKAIDFVQCKPNETPAPKLVNPEAVDGVLTDLVELVNIIDGPASIEVHTKEKKGGTPAFWDTVADACAGHLLSLLEDRGASPSRLTAKGCAGSKGLNVNCVLLKLNPDLFGEEPKSPRPRGTPRRGR